MKELKFKKIIIELNEDGSFKDGLILYQQAIDGKVDSRKRYNSLSIKNMPFSKPQFADIIKKMKTKTKDTEGVKNG